MEIIMRMVPRQDGTYNGNNWDRILGKPAGDYIGREELYP